MGYPYYLFELLQNIFGHNIISVINRKQWGPRKHVTLTFPLGGQSFWKSLISPHCCVGCNKIEWKCSALPGLVVTTFVKPLQNLAIGVI